MKKNFFTMESEILFFSFLSYFFVNFFINPFYFFDKMSFLLSMLSLLFFFYMFICMKMVYLYYLKGQLINLIFFFMMVILTISFYFQNMLLFYMFFEMSVVPIFIYIISWGGDKMKIFAGFYLLFFTFFSSLIFFLGLFLIYSKMGSLDFYMLMITSNFLEKSNIYFYMLIVFFVKMPMFLFHIWLPLAHVESPMMGSMILAAVMLKLGGYGLLRMLLMFFMNFIWKKMYFFMWGILGAILMGIVCFSQVDLKKMVAFSSVSHMSIILMSLFSLSFVGKWSSISMMLSHGLVSSLMFFGLGVLYYRFYSRNLFILGSSTILIPLFGLWWFLVCIMNLGFPPFISFISEFFIFLSLMMESEFFIGWGLLLVMVSSIYTLNLMVYLISGEKKYFSVVFEMNLIEHILFFIHFFILVLTPFLIWII